jgi:TPR repeat protein
MAQYDMGGFYLAGTGVPQDSVRSWEWFQAAADQGDPMAALHLGKMYATGRGLQPSASQLNLSHSCH